MSVNIYATELRHNPNKNNDIKRHSNAGGGLFGGQVLIELSDCRYMEKRHFIIRKADEQTR